MEALTQNKKEKQNIAQIVIMKIDITNRNCVRCNYPKQYPDYKDYDEA